jgi:hypothetical protein
MHLKAEGWTNKIMHGQYNRQLQDGIDKNLTFQWLTRGNLSIESEGFLCAAQEQALNTRAIAKNIYKTAQTDKCRLCNSAIETVMHIAAECSRIAQTDYLPRHNSVAKYIHLRLLQIHAAEPKGKKWYQHEPEKVVETDEIKILWDFNIYTDKKSKQEDPTSSSSTNAQSLDLLLTSTVQTIRT